MRKKRVSLENEGNIFELESEEEKELRKYKVILVAPGYLVVSLEERGNYRVEKTDSKIKVGDEILLDV